MKSHKLKKYGKFPTPPRRKSFSPTTQHKIILLFSILLLFTGVLLLYYLTATGQAITAPSTAPYNISANLSQLTNQILNLTIDPGDNTVNSLYFNLSVTLPVGFRLCENPIYPVTVQSPW